MIRAGLYAAALFVGLCLAPGCGPKPTTQADFQRQVDTVMNAAKQAGAKAFVTFDIQGMEFGPAFQVDLGLRAHGLLIFDPSDGIAVAPIAVAPIAVPIEPGQ